MNTDFIDSKTGQHLDYTPVLEDIEIIKYLYTTKQSKIWLVKYKDDNFYILKGYERSKISNPNFIFNERKILEDNNNNNSNNGESTFSKFIKAIKDDNYIYLLISFIEGITLSELAFKEKIFNFHTIATTKETTTNNNQKTNLYISLSYQLAQLLNNLHERNIIYRDLKLNNLIMNPKLQLNLIDFGFGKKLSSKEERTYTICGTYHSMAPEMFNKEEGYSFPSDVYSYGILIYELFLGEPPFGYIYNYDESVMKEIIEKAKEENFILECFYKKINKNIEEEDNINNNLTDEFIISLIDLIKKCTCYNADERLTVKEMLEHNFFKIISSIKVDIDDDYIKSIIEAVKFNGEYVEDYEKKEIKEKDVFDDYF
jgi:serine/threonine protein kinase